MARPTPTYRVRGRDPKQQKNQVESQQDLARAIPVLPKEPDRVAHAVVTTHGTGPRRLPIVIGQSGRRRRHAPAALPRSQRDIGVLVAEEIAAVPADIPDVLVPTEHRASSCPFVIDNLARRTSCWIPL